MKIGKWVVPEDDLDVVAEYRYTEHERKLTRKGNKTMESFDCGYIKEEETFVPPWDVLEDEQEFGNVMNSIFEDFYKL